jgi:hypothetical protein
MLIGKLPVVLSVGSIACAKNGDYKVNPYKI